MFGHVAVKYGSTLVYNISKYYSLVTVSSKKKLIFWKKSREIKLKVDLSELTSENN